MVELTVSLPARKSSTWTVFDNWLLATSFWLVANLLNAQAYANFGVGGSSPRQSGIVWGALAQSYAKLG